MRRQGSKTTKRRKAITWRGAGRACHAHNKLRICSARLAPQADMRHAHHQTARPHFIAPVDCIFIFFCRQNTLANWPANAGKSIIITTNSDSNSNNYNNNNYNDNNHNNKAHNNSSNIALWPPLLAFFLLLLWKFFLLFFVVRF